MKKTVWVIGVSPPCPRCDLLRQRVQNLARELGIAIDFHKLAYSDQDARAFAASIGKTTGTAKDVERLTGISIDWDRLSDLGADPPTHPEDMDSLEGPARRWSPEFDAVLRPCQERADAAGILMTPILVVDGNVVHHGSVPSMDQLRAWLSGGGGSVL